MCQQNDNHKNILDKIQWCASWIDKGHLIGLKYAMEILIWNDTEFNFLRIFAIGTVKQNVKILN